MPTFVLRNKNGWVGKLFKLRGGSGVSKKAMTCLYRVGSTGTILLITRTHDLNRYLVKIRS